MRKGFTLIELLVVIAVIAILSVVVVLTLNPAEMLRQARDATRLSDMEILAQAISYSRSDTAPPGLGTSSTTYVSLLDALATTTAGSNCSSLGLSSSSNGYAYHCTGSAYSRSVNGNGWVPINFSTLSMGSPLTQLPLDPIDISSTNEFYQYVTDGAAWEVAATPESQKYEAQTNQFAAGSNQTFIPPPGPAFVQSGTSTSTSVTLSNVGAGHFLAIMAGWEYYGSSAAYITNCSDGYGDTFYYPSSLFVSLPPSSEMDVFASTQGTVTGFFNQLLSIPKAFAMLGGPNYNTGMCYATNVHGGNTTVTVTLFHVPDVIENTLNEFSGIATTNPLDVLSRNAATIFSVSTNDITSNASTTTQADLILGLTEFSSTSTPYGGTVSAGTGQTLINQINTAGNVGLTTEYSIQSSAGSVAASFTGSTTTATQFKTIMAAFE